MELDGKVAIVTGASRGVGAAVAVALARAGARVACAARSTEAQPQSTPGTLDATVRAIDDAGGDAIAVRTNLANDAAVVAMVEQTATHFGGVDILVNNAAITFVGDIELPMKRQDLIFSVNLRAPMIAVQTALPYLRAGGGAIVNVSSVAGLNYFPGQMAYGMSKIALEHFTMSLAPQISADGITVNTFRIDVPVASEGFVANLPDADHSDWEPSEVAAEGVLWMLRQPLPYTGNNVGMAELRATQHIMPSRAARPHTQSPTMSTRSPLQGAATLPPEFGP